MNSSAKNQINSNDYINLKFLKIKELIKLENLKFAYKFNKNLLPEQIKKCVNTDHLGQSLRKTHSYNTRNKSLPNKPKTRKKYYSNSILCKSIDTFLAFKDITKQIGTLSGFVTQCKKDLLAAQC